jgi:hypothetical protein
VSLLLKCKTCVSGCICEHARVPAAPWVVRGGRGMAQCDVSGPRLDLCTAVLKFTLVSSDNLKCCILCTDMIGLLAAVSWHCPC